MQLQEPDPLRAAAIGLVAGIVALFSLLLLAYIPVPRSLSGLYLAVGILLAQTALLLADRIRYHVRVPRGGIRVLLGFRTIAGVVSLGVACVLPFVSVRGSGEILLYGGSAVAVVGAGLLCHWVVARHHSWENADSA